jgi:hypothetical protein
MRSRSYEEDVEGEGSKSEDTTLDTKHEDSISKSKNTLSEVEARMERMEETPLDKDFAYFLQIGLTGDGINPHRLKVGSNISLEKLVEVFNKGILRSGFCYT